MVNRVSSPLSFFLSASIAATYIFTAPPYTTKITLKPCALNAELQLLILRFNKISLRIPLEEERGGRVFFTSAEYRTGDDH
jgi:hypothetical protein